MFGGVRGCTIIYEQTTKPKTKKEMVLRVLFCAFPLVRTPPRSKKDFLRKNDGGSAWNLLRSHSCGEQDKVKVIVWWGVTIF